MPLPAPGIALGYDAENRQTSAGSYSYAYDGDGRRVSKTGGGVTTVYVYDAGGQLASEYSSAAAVTPPCVTCYLSYDHLGSVRLVTDASANVISRHDFLPFGEEIVNAAGRTAGLGFGGTDDVSQRFTGKERDAESGLDYFGARYYGGALGRWASPDWSAKPEPIPYAKLDNPQTLNLYSYVLNNPLRTVDPDGHADDPCSRGNSNCFVTTDEKRQQATVVQTSTQTKVSKDENGNSISTTVRTTNTETISTADANRGQVLGGTQTVTTTVANTSDPTQPVSTTTTSSNLNPLQATNAVGRELTAGLQDFVKPTFLENLWGHKIGTAGVLVGTGAGACALAEPCGALVGTGTLIGVTVAAGVAAIYDFGTHP